MAWLRYGVQSARNKAATVAGGLMLALTVSAAQAEVDILALGDSLTQGYGLAEQDGLVPQLRGWLAERGHEVRLVNAGVSGDTTAGGLARFDWSLTPEIDAVIVALGGNDLLRGIDPASTRANLDAILQIAETKGLEVLLIGMSAPGNFGPGYKADFDAIYPNLAERYDTVYMADFFEGLSAERASGSAQEMTDWMQRDGLHPNARGVARIVDAMGPKVEALIARIE